VCVCVCVCVLVTFMGPAKMGKPIKMPFGPWGALSGGSCEYFRVPNRLLNTKRYLQKSVNCMGNP